MLGLKRVPFRTIICSIQNIQIKVEVISSTAATIGQELLATSQGMCITINIHRRRYEK